MDAQLDLEDWVREDDEPLPTPDDSMAPVAMPPLTPTALRRQARAAKIVRVAVGGSLVVCLVAFVRTSVDRVLHPRVAEMRTTAAAITSPPAPEPSVAVREEAATALLVDEDDTVTLAPEAAAASAKDYRDDAHLLLERGDANGALEAAQRSVSLDPTDADGWLVLGAAAVQLHELAIAHDAFLACVKRATKGPAAECRALLTRPH
jgi:hypothetical protein